MAIRTDRSVFYHIPKTGGIWVKEAIRKSGLRYDRCKDRRKVSHRFALKREHAPPVVVRDEYKEGLFSFCFVRHPMAWYKSYWCYVVKIDYLNMKFPLDRFCWDDVFEKFVVNVLEKFPDGFVKELYQCYDLDNMDFIGKQESLADDLIRALTLAGEDFNEEDLRRTKWRNVSAGRKKFGDMCVLSKETRNRILDSEKWVLEQFYA